MPRWASLWIYRLLLPLFLMVALPGWWMRMLRRGGMGTGLAERIGIYRGDLECEPCGAVHLHAVSVGEVMIALRLIRSWHRREPGKTFVLATGTATGHAVATAARIDGLRVTYAPLDFRISVRRYLDRFEPLCIVLVEGEAWPQLLIEARRRGIPVVLVNARMSPRSAKRYRRFAAWLRPYFSLLDWIAIQESGDESLWKPLGIDSANIHVTGSLKYDPEDAVMPQPREAFDRILSRFGNPKRIVLAASTHAGEDAWIARAAIHAADDVLMVMAPRHAERRDEVVAELVAAGFRPVLRSACDDPFSVDVGVPVLVIDSTGELRDWTAHADVVVIGKSFLAKGGQSPVEAVLAGKPVVFGPHMENFEPLASSMVAHGGAIRADDAASLVGAIRAGLDDGNVRRQTEAASACLARHRGAIDRVLDLLGARRVDG
jgi:3-deoxy-D-manno-octulosonic-acid transferase